MVDSIISLGDSAEHQQLRSIAYETNLEIDLFICLFIIYLFKNKKKMTVRRMERKFQVETCPEKMPRRKNQLVQAMEQVSGLICQADELDQK